MRIGDLAAQCGISTDTVRFYEKENLIRSERMANGYRDYAEEMLFIVQFIRTAQTLGFTLAEIREDIPALSSGELPQARVEEILLKKIATIDERIAELIGLRERLEDYVGRACPINMQCEALVGDFLAHTNAGRKSA